MIPFPDKKYQIIYADPPWRFDMTKDTSGKDFLKYPTMGLDDIKNLPVDKITDKDCVLFIWCVFPMLQEGLDTIKAWGFSFKTIGFTWGKLYKNGSVFMGLGNWTRSNAEICLLGVKGKPKRINSGVRSLLLSIPREHSKKPTEIRGRIVQLLGDLPRIELFARPPKDLLFEDESYQGWDVWGDEV